MNLSRNSEKTVLILISIWINYTFAAKYLNPCGYPTSDPWKFGEGKEQQITEVNDASWIEVVSLMANINLRFAKDLAENMTAGMLVNTTWHEVETQIIGNVSHKFTVILSMKRFEDLLGPPPQSPLNISELPILFYKYLEYVVIPMQAIVEGYKENRRDYDFAFTKDFTKLLFLLKELLCELYDVLASDLKTYVSNFIQPNQYFHYQKTMLPKDYKNIPDIADRFIRDSLVLRDCISVLSTMVNLLDRTHNNTYNNATVRGTK